MRWISLESLYSTSPSPIVCAHFPQMFISNAALLYIMCIIACKNPLFLFCLCVRLMADSFVCDLWLLLAASAICSEQQRSSGLIVINREASAANYLGGPRTKRNNSHVSERVCEWMNEYTTACAKHAFCRRAPKSGKARGEKFASGRGAPKT